MPPEKIEIKYILLNKLRYCPNEMTSFECDELQRILLKISKRAIKQNDSKGMIACLATGIILAFVSSKFP